MGYLAALTATDNGEGYKNYLNSAIKYLATSLVAEIKKLHPDIDPEKIDYNDPQWKPLVEKLAYVPRVMGSLAVTLGLDEKVLTEDMWSDLFSGWIKTDILPPNSYLRAYAKDTPKGSMVALSNNPSKFDEKGEYIYDGQRRPTNEALFTLGKGLSLWLVAKEIESPGTLKTVQDIHNRVMREEIIPLLEKQARIRAREDDELTEKNAYEVAVISFMHIETRNLQPHIHFHDQILNTAIGVDGRLSALHTDAIYDIKALLDAKYMSAMKTHFENTFNLEFQAVLLKKDEDNEFLDQESKSVASFDIHEDIVPKELVEHYSARIKEIEKSLKEKGIANTANSRKVEQKSTRDDKSDMSPSELLEMWDKEFKALGYSAKDLTNRVRPKPINYIPVTDRKLCRMFHRKHHEQTRDKQEIRLAKLNEARFADEEAASKPAKEEKISRSKIELTFEKKIISSFATKIGKVEFKLSQMEAHIVKNALSTCTSAIAWSEADRIVEEQCVLHLPKERYDYFAPLLDGKITDNKLLKKMNFEFEREARFITRDTIRMSDYISKSCLERVDEDRWLVPVEIANEHIRKYEKRMGFLLSPDQVADIRAAFTEKGSIVNTDGQAGTGKSTAAEVKVQIWESQGFNVIGTSIANTATKGLAKAAGLKEGSFYNSAKLLKMLDEGKLPLNDRSIILFDEAGMSDLETLYRVIHHANKAGAKINFIGEACQLQPIGAGNQFKFLNENFVSRPLTTINRQNTQEKKDNVKLWQKGDGKAGIEDLFDNDHVKITKTNMDAFELVAELYVNNPKDHTDKIIMSALNGDNDIINTIIKRKLRERGELDANSTQIKLFCADGVEREFGAGDRIAFFKNTKTDDAVSMQIDNSETGKIQSLRKNLRGRVVAVVLEMDNKDAQGNKIVRFIDIDKKRPQFRLGYSGTIHKSQGQSKHSAYQVISHADHNAFNQYVAASRHKNDYTLIMSEEFKDMGIKKLRHKPPSERQIKKIEWLRDEKKVAIPDIAWETHGNARLFLKEFVDVQMPKKEDKTHALDDYSEIIKMFSTQNFKKNVSDYVEVKDGLKIMRDLAKERIADMEMFRMNKADLQAIDKIETKYKKRVKARVNAEIPRAPHTATPIVVPKVEASIAPKPVVVEVAKKKKKKQSLSLG